MAPRNVMRLGDPGTHGGAIVTASPDTYCNMPRRVARLGDIYACPIHGPNPIVTASEDTFCNGRGVARLNDVTACGARLIDGSPDTFCN